MKIKATTRKATALLSMCKAIGAIKLSVFSYTYASTTPITNSWNGGERFQMDGRKERSAHYDSIPRLKPVSKRFVEVPSKHDFFCYRGDNDP